MSAAPARLAFHDITPAAPLAGTVIWLHGLGADGYDFVPIVDELALPPDLPLRFVFPHAPEIPVTINGGVVMPAWYDVAYPDLRRKEDETGIHASQRQVARLIDEETAHGVGSERILIAGFSQGGAIALQTALRYPRPLAGVAALSSYLPLANTGAAEAAPANRGLPVFMGHGREDPIVPLAAGIASRDKLRHAGYPVTWRDYAMPHAVCGKEIQDLRTWLVGVYRALTG